MTTPVTIALGGNMGNSIHHFKDALAHMQNKEITILNTSRVYETAPIYETSQNRFYNMALCATTSLAPQTVLATLKHIESTLGRIKTYRNGPRVIDLDILYYGDTIMDTPTLCIPHIRISERQFVLQPLCDLMPDFVDPRTQETIACMAMAAPVDPTMRVYMDDLYAEHITNT